MPRSPRTVAVGPNDELSKKFAPTSYANFDENYQPINDAYPGTAPSDYTVQAGDTLSSIAARIWGDRAMWYLIADANGLSGAERLSEGTRLVIPNKVTNIHNNAGTFKVYDAGEAIGDVSPTLPAPPPPPKDEGCGAIGQIVMIVVAVVAAVATAGALAPLLGAATVPGATLLSTGLSVLGGGLGVGLTGAVVAGAVGGAVGSIVSQGVGIAIGQVDQFSWKQVGQSALGGGITAGVATGISQFGPAFLRDVGEVASAGRAAIGSGINMAVHSDWDWRNVMASAVGGAVGSAVGGALGASGAFAELGTTLGETGSKLVSGMAAGMAGQMAGPGGRVNFSAAFAGALGNALGGALTGTSAAPDQSDAETDRLNRYENNAIQSTAPDQTAAETARLIRNSVTQVDANTAIDNPPFGPSPASSGVMGGPGQMQDADLRYRARLASSDDIGIYSATSQRMSGLNISKISRPDDPDHYVIGAYLDGTWNLRGGGGLLDTRPGINSTNVGILEWMSEDQSSNYRTKYFPGVGTDSYTKLIGGATGAGVTLRAEDAYNWMAKEVNGIYSNNQSATFDFLATAFSRGSLEARMLLHMLDERGIPDYSSRYEVTVGEDHTEVRYDRNIIEPRRAGLSGVLFDTVTTGVGDFYNIDLPDRAQIYHPIARDEMRPFFPIAPLARFGEALTSSWFQPVLPGGHSDIGNNHDRGGLGDWNLQLAHQFMTQNLGLPLMSIPDANAPNPANSWIHEMRGEQGIAPPSNLPFVRPLAPRYVPPQPVVDLYGR